MQAGDTQTRPGPETAAFKGPRAFTLIELLVVIAIIGVVILILVPTLAQAKRCVVRVREMAAAQQLMPAYQSYAEDSKGKVLPGYLPVSMISGMGARQIEVLDENGARITGTPAQRYPWRLAPYLNYDMSALYKNVATLAEYRSRADYQYVISISPSFGLNSDFVGGNALSGYGFNQTALNSWGAFYVTRIDEPKFPSNLLVFATARGVNPDGGDPVPGFHEVQAPRLQQRRWAPAQDFEETDDPLSLGFVHPRHEGRAVVAMMDGHVEAQTPAQLDDMRRWSNQATAIDWSVGRP